MKNRMHARFLVLSIIAGFFSLPSARAAETPDPPFDPVSFGVNVDSALINPWNDRITGSLQLHHEVSTILYAVRRIGGRTIRWFGDDVWRQYECGKDPENQTTGELDPAWYAMTKTLLDEAQKQHVKVVVSMMNLASGTFAGLPKDEAARMKAIASFAAYRAGLAGKDRYQGNHSCRNSVQNGYYGTVDVQEMFQRPDIREHMRQRFIRMALYLKDFPALGAIELFNEPSFDFTHQNLYAQTVRQLEGEIRRSDPRLSRIPVYSGTAYWDPGIVNSAQKTGDLEHEPFVTLHNYADYMHPDIARQERNITWVMGLIPGKQLVIAEAGDQSSIPLSRQGNAEMVRILFAEANELHVGLWVWGEDLTPENKPVPDYKWSFNPLSLAGGSFRPFFIDAAAESKYDRPHPVQVHDIPAKLDRSENISIVQVPESDASPGKRLRWRLTMSEGEFLASTRDGILLQNFTGNSNLFAPPAPTVLINENPQLRQWAEVSGANQHWQLDVYRCRQEPTPGTIHDTIPTPDYVIGLAERDGRKDFQDCVDSDHIVSATMY